MPKFSVIMPSRLADYGNAAQFRDQKIVRAINSVLAQTFEDFELLVISDGCELTKSIVSSHFLDKRLRLLECKHKQLFDNLPRNTGLQNAKGDYIPYLDIDDYWGANHLQIINNNIGVYDWVYFNDYIFNKEWVERPVNIRMLGRCGTSNICHARKLNMKWDRPGYAHDFYFNQKLRHFPNNKKIETPEYFVMHIPQAYDL